MHLLRRLHATAALALIAVAVPVLAAEPAPVQRVAPLPNAAIDRAVEAEMAKQHIPGVAVAIVRDGRVVRQAGYGLADIEAGTKVDANTAFSIGSVSKQFLATGIMLLVQDGKIDIDAPVSRYIEDAPAAWSGITLRHLLSHTSGLVREGPAYEPFKIQPDIEVIRSAYTTPLRFRPGEKFEYSNIGYFTLAEIIARVSGMPWDRFCQKRIFGPLGMTGTRTTSLTDVIAHRAGGYEWDGGYYNVRHFRALRPSGAFVSTTTDLAKWEAELANGSLLTPANKAAMWTMTKLNDGKPSGYGLGWFLSEFEGHREIQHGGSLPGFSSQFLRLPDDKLTIIVLTNADAEPGGIAHAVARAILPAKPR